MADLTVTANSVVTAGQFATGIAGESITAGQAVYMDAADSQKIKKAVATSQAAAAAVGIALNAAAAGQKVSYSQDGAEVTVGGSPTVGKPYYVSAGAAGGIAPEADLTTGNFTTFLGFCLAANKITQSVRAAGVARA